MCFENDAKNWKGLNDVASFTLGIRGFTDVIISENWFASCVAFKCSYQNKDRITYAKDLDGGTLRMQVFKVKVS